MKLEGKLEIRGKNINTELFINVVEYLIQDP